MTNVERTPLSFPVGVEEQSSKRRAVFSQEVRNVGSWHVLSDDDNATLSANRHRRKVDDDSLRLIDDLTNRPLDPLFSDARLTQQKPHSRFSIWFTRIIVFIICIAVGFIGSVFVRQLNTDPRKQVRASLISELEQQNVSLKKITTEVTDLHAKVVKQSDSMPNSGPDSTLTQDEMANGTLPVKGPGIVVTLADPVASAGQTGSAPRENSGSHIRVVTDADLQSIVLLLWKAGAEAISINGQRIGVSTSVRTAGQTILIGVNQVASPYKIEAIGNQKDLSQQMSGKSQPDLYSTLNSAGIHPQVSKSYSLKLAAAETTNVTYAKRSK
ncbi:DUF881 domain-containing protein [Bifidobacterium sp. ESL0745]|uniref:DUF881 domain-containing protein n=1 Tax=Bifidobacterium sp. ESL0745 TaxID=2983226 RepID=UPI0023F764B1|nr:DUF881 domain-containing protein [Bifidobacterium sp. ESL0745]MDF7665031.1 DUF881 domain-containing protein [Bifidobacterium sp. ESL0745]